MSKKENTKNPIHKGSRDGGVKIYHSIFFYLPWLLKEMLISGLEVAKLVLTPKTIDPKIVKLKTNLDSSAGKVIYANSITLTPGTFTIDIEKDSLLVHYLVKPKGDDNQMENKVRGIIC